MESYYYILIDGKVAESAPDMKTAEHLYDTYEDDIDAEDLDGCTKTLVYDENHNRHNPKYKKLRENVIEAPQRHRGWHF